MRIVRAIGRQFSWRVQLQARYEKANPPWQFGDLILMHDPDSGGNFEHACNYIAADIVFTIHQERKANVPSVGVDGT